MTSTIGIPIKLLNEAQVYRFHLERPPYTLKTLTNVVLLLQGHVVTLEITSGQVYRGKLLEGAPALALFLPPPLTS